MTQLIDKAAVVAEIEERIATYKNVSGADRRTDALISFKDFIDTLEVKEVDFEKYYQEFRQKELFGNAHVRTISEMMAFTAKHFFELALSLKK